MEKFNLSSTPLDTEDFRASLVGTMENKFAIIEGKLTERLAELKESIASASGPANQKTSTLDPQPDPLAGSVFFGSVSGSYTARQMSAQDVRMACVGMACQYLNGYGLDAGGIAGAADILAAFVLNGKAKVEG